MTRVTLSETLSETRERRHASASPSLERVLGDPFADGAVTFAAIAEAEDVTRLTPAVRELAQAWGVGAELVPEAFGGRRTSAARLVTRLRPLFRRDLSLGVDLVVAPLAVMTATLASGDEAQRDPIAARIASGARVGAVLEGAAAPTPGGLRVHARLSGWVAEGESPLVAGAADAEMWAMPASAPDGAAALVLLDPADARVARDPWVETVGLRGTRFGAATVRAAEPPDVLLDGSGTGTLARARLETSAILAALVIGAVDTAAHLAVPYAEGRRLYRGTVLDIPHARSLLADVHTDLLIADALAGRALQDLDAGQVDEVAASAAAYLVPHLLTDAMRALSVLFGSTFYARVEPYAVFETFVRDVGSLALLGLGTPTSLGPCVTALDAGDDRVIGIADAHAAASGPLQGRGASFGDRARRRDRTDAAATRRLAREAAILVAAEACIDLGRAGAASATDEWLAAAVVRLGARLTNRKESLPAASIESAVHDLTSCVESGRSITLERAPIFGR